MLEKVGRVMPATYSTGRLGWLCQVPNLLVAKTYIIGRYRGGVTAALL